MRSSLKRVAWAFTLGLALALGAAAGCRPGGGNDEPASPTSRGSSSEAPAGPPQIIILISIDTLRADHLGLYGYDRPTSPVLDSLAREAVVFDDASAPAPWTLPAHASMLTGLYPLRHGVVHAANRLPHEVPTLAATLAEHGFTTAAVVNSTWLKRETYRLTRGFQEYLWVKEMAERMSPSTWVTDQAVTWLDGRGDRPLFLFMHYFDVHADYTSLPEYESRFVTPYDGKADGTLWQLYLAGLDDEYFDFCHRKPDPEHCSVSVGLKEGTRIIDESVAKVRFDPDDVRHLVDLYDAEIRQIDAEIGRFLNLLRARGLMDEVALIVTADHGEEFMEHGSVGHFRSQYQESLHVPLLIRAPGIGKGVRISEPVSLVDIAPTILGLAGLDPGKSLDGSDLAPLWRIDASRNERLVFEERSIYGEASGGLTFDLILKNIVPVTRSLRRGRYKLHHESKGNTYELYDLSADPGERVDIAAREPEITAQLIGLMRERYQNTPSDAVGNKVELEDEDAERLRSLGYLR